MQDVTQWTYGPSPWVSCFGNDTVDARGNGSARAYRAEFKGDNQSAAHKVSMIQGAPSLSQDNNLRAIAEVMPGLTDILPLADNAAKRVNHGGANRYAP